MKNQLFKIFFRINGLAVLTTFFLAVIMMIVLQNSKPRGEELEKCYMPFFTEILATGSALFISFSTISVLLNLNTKFRQSKLRIALSYFIFPIVMSVIIWFSLFNHEEVDKENILIAMIIYFPVWFFIIKEYSNFKK
jgi:hypothetical protein